MIGVSKVTAKDIRERFARAERKHLEIWDAANKSPVQPKATVIISELKKGKVEVIAANLEDVLDGTWNRREFDSVITTPSLKAWRTATEDHDRRRKAFIERVEEVKERHLDCVLFDHANAFVILTAFQSQQWEAGAI